MVGRNDPCTCGSGKKYKKCCQSKQSISIEEVQVEELERILQTFYDEYPKRDDVSEYLAMVQEWRKSLETYLVEEMIEAVVMDEFFFHRKPEIWQGYLEKQQKKAVRPSVVQVLKRWTSPQVFIGEVLAVEEEYMTVKSILEDQTILLRRESEKPVPVGVHLYCFILPDGTPGEGHYLAVSSLVFFPKNHGKVFTTFTEQFMADETTSASLYLKENGAAFWELLGKDGYEGGEFTDFEAGVLLQAEAFLEEKNRKSEQLLEVIEDYLVELQPNARKEVAIAAGAIRFGQENGLFEPLKMTIKEIADSFDVSTSSLNKYYKDLNDYYANMNH